MRQQRVEHVLRALPGDLARRFDQGDGLGQRAAVAGQHAVDEIAILADRPSSAIGSHASSTQALAGRCAARMARSTSWAHCGIGVPGPKMPVGAGLEQDVVVLRRDHAADEDDDVVGALLLAAP